MEPGAKLGATARKSLGEGSFGVYRAVESSVRSNGNSGPGLFALCGAALSVGVGIHPVSASRCVAPASSSRA